MSTLTKVLIVLLSVFSLFLCGVVVTYVANADNYKEQYSNQLHTMQSARNAKTAAEKDLAEYKTAAEQTQKDLEQQLTDMRIERDNLQGSLADAKLENSRLVTQMTNSQATVTTTTTAQQKALDQLEATQATNKDLEAQVTRLKTELDETNQTLLNKLGVIEDLQARNNQLTETNQDLEARANRYLQPSGRVTAAAQPVTPTPGPVQPALPTRQINLDGRIVRVDPASELAEISIGEAAGVRENMRFYVIRGDSFIANLTVQYVDSEIAVGTLSEVQSLPQAGDMVTTNL